MTLATKTGEVKFLQQGKRGMLPYPAGEYDLHTSYVCTDMLAPYVLYNGIYYVMNQVTTWIGQGMPSNINTPQKDYAVNGTKATWIPFEDYKAIYVELLMANFAKLASAVFYGDYMFSQQGVDASGNPTNDYRGFDKGEFIPNLLLNFLTGKIISNDAEIRGTVNATDGSFTGEVNAETGKIGGFEIGSGRIGIDDGSSGSVNGMFLYNDRIGFNGEKQQAMIGAFSILGSKMLGSFTNTISQVLMDNVGLVFNIKNGNHNYAFLGDGDGMLNGVLEGYRLNHVYTSRDNEAIRIDFSRGKYVEAAINNNNCVLILPRLADLRASLGLSTTTPNDISARLTIVCRTGNFKLYGRANLVVNGSSINNDQHPYLRDNDFGDHGYWDMGAGDVLEVLLTYSTSQYNAYMVSIQR